MRIKQTTIAHTIAIMDSMNELAEDLKNKQCGLDSIELSSLKISLEVLAEHAAKLEKAQEKYEMRTG